MNTETITLNSKKYEVTRPKLKRWVELETLKIEALDLAKHGKAVEFSDRLLSYVSLFLGVSVSEIENLPWTEITSTWITLIGLCRVSIELPFYQFHNLSKEKEPVWEYKQRTWYTWLHELASAYGWNIEYISELDVDDASALLQEIFINDQLDKEFQWMLSEIAYPYNEASKRGEFKPLPRPVWMREEVRYIKEHQKMPSVKIRKDHLPIGNIVKLHG